MSQIENLTQTNTWCSKPPKIELTYCVNTIDLSGSPICVCFKISSLWHQLLFQILRNHGFFRKIWWKKVIGVTNRKFGHKQYLVFWTTRNWTYVCCEYYWLILHTNFFVSQNVKFVTLITFFVKFWKIIYFCNKMWKKTSNWCHKSKIWQKTILGVLIHPKLNSRFVWILLTDLPH